MKRVGGCIVCGANFLKPKRGRRLYCNRRLCQRVRLERARARWELKQIQDPIKDLARQVREVCRALRGEEQSEGP